MTLSLEDKLEITELVARFAHYSDFQDWDALAGLYVTDVVTELSGMNIRYSGVASQIEHARISAEQTNGKNRHYNMNLFIEEGIAGTFAIYSFLNVNAGANAMDARIVTSGRMRDTMIKTDQGWRIAHRTVEFDQHFDLEF